MQAAELHVAELRALRWSLHNSRPSEQRYPATPLGPYMLPGRALVAGMDRGYLFSSISRQSQKFDGWYRGSGVGPYSRSAKQRHNQLSILIEHFRNLHHNANTCWDYGLVIWCCLAYIKHFRFWSAGQGILQREVQYVIMYRAFVHGLLKVLTLRLLCKQPPLYQLEHNLKALESMMCMYLNERSPAYLKLVLDSNTRLLNEINGHLAVWVQNLPKLEYDFGELCSAVSDATGILEKSWIVITPPRSEGSDGLVSRRMERDKRDLEQRLRDFLQQGRELIFAAVDPGIRTPVRDNATSHSDGMCGNDEGKEGDASAWDHDELDGQGTRAAMPRPDFMHGETLMSRISCLVIH